MFQNYDTFSSSNFYTASSQNISSYDIPSRLNFFVSISYNNITYPNSEIMI